MSPTTRRAHSRAAVGLTALLAPLAFAATPALALPGSDDFGVYANPGETLTVEFPFRADGEEYEWVVPAGVTEITVELAAGSGASYEIPPAVSPGGAGGWLTATVPVDPGAELSLLVGAAGTFGSGAVIGGPTFATEAMRGGGATVLASASDVLAVAGGGGAGSRCIDTAILAVCGPGGAGGFSLAAEGADGMDGTSVQPAPGYSFVGFGATVTAPGTSADTISFVTGDLELEDVQVVSPGVPPGVNPARVDASIIRPGLGAVPGLSTLGGGGSGYYGGGHGAEAAGTTRGEPADVVQVVLASGGGGGGSGYLVDGAEVVELRDNVGDGFASITYTVPEPDVVDAPAPAIALGATIVQAGASLTLTGSSFDPERDYPVILNSDPVLLGTATTDVRGAFSATLLVPTTVPPGEHVITVGDASIPITVTAADAPLVADGTGDVTAFAAAPELPPTGADPLAASILGALAVALLATGAAAIRASRQPLQERQPSPARQPFPARRAATRVR